MYLIIKPVLALCIAVSQHFLFVPCIDYMDACIGSPETIQEAEERFFYCSDVFEDIGSNEIVEIWNENT